MNLNDLILKEDLSVRSINICLAEGLTNTQLIGEYLSKHGTFLNLKNCGIKSQNELLAICGKYFQKEINSKKTRDLLLKNLTVRQQQILDNYFSTRFSQLSVRPKNAIETYLGEEVNFSTFYKLISENFFDFKSIPNVGKLAREELHGLLNDLNSFIDELSEKITLDELSTLASKIILESLFDVPEPIIEKMFASATADYFPVFKIIYLLLEENLLLTNNETLLFNKYFLYRTTSQKSELRQIANFKNITVERVRQLRNGFLDQFKAKFSFVKNFQFNEIGQYGLDLNAEIISVDPKFVERINKREGTDFSELFITKIFSILLDNTHGLVGDEINIHYVNQKKGEVNFKNLYLISNDIIELFDINGFLNDIHLRMSGRIEENYKLNIRGLILPYLNPSGHHKIISIRNIIDDLLYKEFGKIIINDEIKFERNTPILNVDYAKEALNAMGISSTGYHVTEIIDWLSIKYPSSEFNVQSFANLMSKDKATFIGFGRQSTFGLKTWERGEIKGGTIRDIVEAYLQDKTFPLHITEVIDYVSKYRNTNVKSVFSNLNADESNTFAFFPGQFIGLKSKKYDFKLKRVTGGLFTKRNLRQYNLINIDVIVDTISKAHGYLPIQISSVLKEKIRNGDININEYNQLIIDE